MRTVILSLLIPVLLGCAGIGGSPGPPSGERLYRSKCRSCHSLEDPEEHSDEEWKIYVKKYGEKLNLSEREKEEILQYLMMENH